MEYNLYKGVDTKVAADIALKSRLYVSGWMLSSYLKKIRKGEIDARVVLCTENGCAVGICVQVLSGVRKGFTQVFVKKSYRKRGIGTKMASLVKFEGCYGVKGVTNKVWFRNGYKVTGWP